MEEKTIDAAPAPKKPYVRPQLHNLTGSDADGKSLIGAESGPFGPS
jgi:hypothetical protein